MSVVSSNLLHSNGCYRARHFLDEFDSVLEDPGAFYIVDNKQPITNAIAMTLEIACPDHQKTHVSFCLSPAQRESHTL